MESHLHRALRDAFKKIADDEGLAVDDPQMLSEEVATRMANMAGIYPEPNLAVEICCGNYSRLVEEKTSEDSSAEAIAKVGRAGYCGVLPRLNDGESIRDFIACVVHGMAIGVIPSTEGTRLLYGAQVAHSALPGGRKRRKKTTKSATKTTSDATPNPVSPAT